MKRWRIYYTIYYMDGKKTEHDATIEAGTFREAMEMADTNILKPYRMACRMDKKTEVIEISGIVAEQEREKTA